MFPRMAFRAVLAPKAQDFDRAAPGNNKKRQDMMVRILKFLLLLALIAFVGLVGYAYLGNLEPQQSDVTVPVELNVGN